MATSCRLLRSCLGGMTLDVAHGHARAFRHGVEGSRFSGRSVPSPCRTMASSSTASSSRTQRCGHHTVAQPAPRPRTTTPDTPRAVVSRGRRERPVRGARAAVRQRGGGVAPGPGGAGTTGRADSAPAPLGGRRDGDRATLGPARGFSLHANVAVPARRRDQLERLVRYLVRPPLALDRLTESPGGQLLYQFRRPWRDGSTALLLDPLELLERLAALVPPPAGRCSRTTGCWPRAPAGDRPSCRSHCRPTRGRRRRRSRDAGPGPSSCAGCSGLRCWCVTAAPGRGGSWAR